MTMPGLTLSIRQAVAAMSEVAGLEPAKLIRWESQVEILQMVAGWRFDYVTTKAQALGLRRDAEFGDIIRNYSEHNMTAA